MIENNLKYSDGSEVKIYFDPIEHIYMVNDEQIYSASSISKQKTNANVLINWAIKKTSDYYLKNLQAGQAYTEIELENMYKESKQASKKEMTEAGSIGTHVHNHIENYIHGKDIPEIFDERISNAFNEFKKWYDQQDDLELVNTEQVCFSKKHKFVGTYDALFKRNNEYVIFDWKTSNNIYDNFYIQVGGLYALALEEQLDIKIPTGVIVNCSRQGKLKIAEFEINQDLFDVGLACLKLHNFKPNKKKEKKNDQ
jgi:ATP-dependent exoDNAse (exonuclease V) beta subunit